MIGERSLPLLVCIAFAGFAILGMALFASRSTRSTQRSVLSRAVTALILIEGISLLIYIAISWLR